jgi:hypothetical protein
VQVHKELQAPKELKVLRVLLERRVHKVLLA